MADEAFTYEVYDQQLTALIECLTPREITKATKSGLRPSAKVIQRGVVSQLATKHPAAAKYSKEVAIKIWSKGGGYTVKLAQGKVGTKKNKKGVTVADSHIYILRFLSAGTAERYTKKGKFRGSIKASHFFSEGVLDTIDQAANRISADVMKAFEKAVIKAKKAHLPQNSGQPLK